MSRFSTDAIARDARSTRELRKLLQEGKVILQPQHQSECELEQRHYDLKAKHCSCGAGEKYQEVKKLLEEGVVRLQVQHKYGCCAFFTAIHPCDCGAKEKAQKVKKLLMGEQKTPKQNDEVEWDEEAEHYDYD